MVDMTELSAFHGSEESATRMKARHWAEWRLKAYGIIAIGLAGLALIALLSTVLGKAIGVLSANSVTLELPLPADKIDPNGTGDAAEIKKANFTGIYKDHLKDLFPLITGRKDRAELYDITSDDYAVVLQDAVIADPDKIGSSIPVSFRASDVADLYLKGRYGSLDEKSVEGLLSLTTNETDVELFSGANDFVDALGIVKAKLFENAEQMRNRADAQEAGRAEFARRAEQTEDETERASLEAEVTSRAAARDNFIAQAEELERRARTPGGTEALGDDVPSLLVRVGSGWIKMTEVNAQGGKGVILAPLDNENGDAFEIPPADWHYYTLDVPARERKVSDIQVVALETLEANGAISSGFNSHFFTSGDSTQPERAGIWGAMVGSFFTMLVTFVLAFPIGVLAAIYLEEFAPKNRITDLIEVNINNLAAVPSIVFGLLGLAVFLGVFGVPRSAPLAGGIVLALMTLPTIIIASRAAIRAVPPSIRDAALGLGASKIQSTFHHVLPLAMPGILTGSIIGMAQALGETAPLIMIGMVAFIQEIPTGILSNASVLPVQVYSWSNNSETLFESNTAAAICVLLVFLIVMNAIAVFLRKQFERRW